MGGGVLAICEVERGWGGMRVHEVMTMGMTQEVGE